MITPALRTLKVKPGEYYPASPGDFILTHQSNPAAKILRFGQGLRFRGDLKKFARWNHAALVVGDGGQIVEALASGIQRTNLSKYTSIEYVIVSPKIDGHYDIVEMEDFAMWAVGRSYGFVTIIGLGIWSLFGGRFDVSLDGTLICSALVARSLERAGYIFERDPSRVTPADLARHFNVS